MKFKTLKSVTKTAVLVLWGLLGFGSILSCHGAENSMKKKIPPNIIFLLADDQRDNTFGAMGHPYVKTPCVDKLIQNGVRFANCYIAEPVCCPSRVSLFTGMHERIHGIGFSSSYQLTEEQWRKTYPALLRDAGYYTGFIGKFGVEYYTFRGHAAEKFDWWYAHDGWTKFFPKEYSNFSCIPYYEAQNEIITSIMGEAIENFLNELPAGKPFCLSVSFNVPHGSQLTSMYTDYEGWHNMLKPANENPKLQAYPIYDKLYRNLGIEISGDTGTDPYRFIPKRLLDQDKGRKQTYQYDYSRETELENHIRYYQTITGMDEQIGKMIESLNKLGLSDNTIIIYASDNGVLMGEYGMGGKALLYDLTSKIPCFIYDPKLPEEYRGKTVDKLVSSLDIPITILDYAGVTSPAEMAGKSLKYLVYGKDQEWRDELFLESLFTLRDNPFCEGIRKGDWKYVRMFDGVEKYNESDLDFVGKKTDFEQLFNLKEDPDEKNNLLKVYESTPMLDSLRSKVALISQQMNAQRADYLKTHDCLNRVR